MLRAIMTTYFASIGLEAFSLFLRGREIIRREYNTHYYNHNLCTSNYEFRKYNHDLCNKTNESLHEWYSIALLRHVWSNIHFCGSKYCSDIVYEIKQGIPSTFIYILLCISIPIILNQIKNNYHPTLKAIKN